VKASDTHQPTTTMATMANTMTVWYFLIDHNKKPLGEPTSDDLPHDATADDFKKKVKDRRAIDLRHVDAARLEVWRCKDRDVGKGSEEDLEEHIRGFGFSKTNGHVEKVDPRIKVAGLDLDPMEILIVRTPGASQITSFSD
jgi:hypothetical protein